MQMPKSKYEQTKICDMPLHKEMTSVQEVFSIVSIDESGIFELANKQFSELCVLSDINFAGVTDAEQKQLIINLSNVFKTIPCRYSYAVANEYVDERGFNEKIMYMLRGDKYDGLRRNFNTVIKEKVEDARQGLYQTIYLTLAKSEILGTFVSYPNDKIIIVSPMPEYSKCAEETDGVVIYFDTSKGVYVNPMDVDFRGVLHSGIRRDDGGSEECICFFRRFAKGRILH